MSYPSPTYPPNPYQPGDPQRQDLAYPAYGIGFGAAVKRAFQKYARFDGRASRSEYWWFTLAYTVVGLLLYVPFLVIVDLAERRRLSTGRWAGVALAAVLAAVVLALVGLLAGAPRPLLVLVLGVGFLPAAVLVLRADSLGGRAGRHESPV